MDKSPATMDIPEPGIATQKLWDEILFLQDAREQYRELFEIETHERLLRESAFWFAECYRTLLGREIILRIARLSDGAKIGSNSNLSLEAVLQDPQLQNDQALKTKLEAKINEFRVKSEPIRKQRHKYIAHLDHDIVRGAAIAPPNVKREEIDSIIAAAKDIYGLYRSKVYHSSVSFSLVAEGGPLMLISKLRAAKNWEELKERVIHDHYSVTQESPTNAEANWNNLVQRILDEDNHRPADGGNLF